MIGVWKPTLPGRKTVGGGSFKTALFIQMALCVLIILQTTSSAFTTTASYRSTSQPNSLLHAKKQGLGLLSFDLDDTLFPTSEVVRSANEVMISTMHDFGCSEVTIPLFLDNTRTIRKALTDPITYRDLRKKTIRKTLLDSTVFTSTEKSKDMDMLVEECYDAWVNERHEAAERFVFEDAVDTLQNLREAYPDACIAAITNGAGDPLVMPNTLAPYFDMRISGEDEQVFPHRKPHPYIYEYTLRQCGKSIGEDLIWCHVGDCLANDVGASASCGAQAIWMCTEADEESAAARLTDTKRVPEWSTASTSELETRAKQVSQGRDAVAAKIEKLSELPEVIDQILSSSVKLSLR
jgi:putative hydrolase of the HAD superfamily